LDAARPGPTSASERIDSIDVLRGFALLGILVMNIQGFSMVGAAYMNPTAFGDLTGANGWVWALSHVFADQKFMTLFSALFGAGIVMMWERSEAAGRSSTGLHYRRTFWLMVVGAAHAYLLWYGDVLFVYAVCSLWVFWFRKWSPRGLTIAGSLVLLVSPALYLATGLSMPSWPQESIAGFMQTWQPGAAAIAAEVADMQGGWTDQMSSRVPHAIGMHTGALLAWALWRAGGLMLLGMALFKVGFFSAKLSDRVYRRLFVTGMTLGIPIIVLGIRANFAADWRMQQMFFGSSYNYFGSLLVSVAYASAIMLMCRNAVWVSFQRGMGAVGRMALTNYLLQTIICTTIFYGHGLGLFGEVERTGQVLVVAAVWAFQIPFSLWWLERFRFGPFEWLWRSLSYLKLQPMRS
jgi:uncharacterized protein